MSQMNNSKETLDAVNELRLMKEVKKIFIEKIIDSCRLTGIVMRPSVTIAGF